MVIAGKSRSGKTAYTAAAVKAAPLVIAWDIEEQWAKLPGWRGFTSLNALVKAARPRCKLAFISEGDIKADFDAFCGVVFRLGEIMGGCVVIAEELADVTTTAKAPGNWGKLVRRGLKRGITIYAISQRWAEADKTALGNPSEVVCFDSMPMDIDYMSKKTRIPIEELATLQKIEGASIITLPYVHLDIDTGTRSRKKLTFRKK